MSRKLAQAEIILPGNIGDLPVEGFVVDTDSGTGRDLHLQTIENQLLQNLFFQDVFRGCGHAGILEPRDDGLQPGLHFAVHDDVVVDHRHDPVNLDDLGRRQ